MIPSPPVSSPAEPNVGISGGSLSWPLIRPTFGNIWPVIKDAKCWKGSGRRLFFPVISLADVWIPSPLELSSYHFFRKKCWKRKLQWKGGRRKIFLGPTGKYLPHRPSHLFLTLFQEQDCNAFLINCWRYQSYSKSVLERGVTGDPTRFLLKWWAY